MYARSSGCTAMQSGPRCPSRRSGASVGQAGIHLRVGDHQLWLAIREDDPEVLGGAQRVDRYRDGPEAGGTEKCGHPPAAVAHGDRDAIPTPYPGCGERAAGALGSGWASTKRAKRQASVALPIPSRPPISQAWASRPSR